jgi:hypothetical protein
MEFTVVPQTPLEAAKELKCRLEEAKKIGIAIDADDVLSKVLEWNTDYKNERIDITTVPALYPKPSLTESKMFKEETELFEGPYLSILGQVITGQNPEVPEKYLVHVRSTKTHQGNEQVSVAYAGFCEYLLGDSYANPGDVAIKEMGEEIKKLASHTPIFVEDHGNGLELTTRPTSTLDFPMHYIGNMRIRNPLLTFVNYVDPESEKVYPTVENLEGLNRVCKDERDFEVKGFAWVPFGKLDDFWGEVRRADRVYSISGEVCDNLRTYFNVLSK